MKDTRLHTLDIMRFVAALSVLIYHFTARDFSNSIDPDVFSSTSTVSQFGYLGVNLFFMISGFVILASALNRTSLTFMISRFTRLFPTFWFCVSLTALTITLFPEHGNPPTALEYLANLTMLNDYVGIDNIDGVYWTLQAELKFYACILILISVGWINHYKIWLSIWLALTALFLVSDQPFFFGWFITPYYSSYFIAGATFFIIRRDGGSPLTWSLIIGSLIISCCYGYNQAQGFMVLPELFERATAIAIICIFFALFALFSLGKLDVHGNRWTLILGGLTYPLYLIHNRIGKTIYDSYSETVSPYLLTLLVTMFILILSYIIHVYIEMRVSNKIKVKLYQLFKYDQRTEI